MTTTVHDCIIIGAGPGGLQASIYLGRYNRDVLLLDRSGGRTWHARKIENFLSHQEIAGSEIIERGMEQARRFGVQMERETVLSVRKEENFIVASRDREYRSRYVIVSSGVFDNLPAIEGVFRFLGRGYYTCLDCDGYRLTGKKAVVLGDRIEAVNVALAVKEMFTPDVTFIPYRFALPDPAAEVLADEQVPIIADEPVAITGVRDVDGLVLKSGKTVPCDGIMATFGTKLNDEFLSGLGLKRDAAGVKYVVNSVYESSRSGLYIVGPLNTGQDQAVIAAGEGAVAAIDINKHILEEDHARNSEYHAVCSL